MGPDLEGMHRRAVELVNTGRLIEARHVLTDAADHAADVDMRARIAGTLAAVLVRTGEPDEAERVCEEALRLPGLQPQSLALLAGQMGSVAERVGRLDVAERWLTRGIDGLDDAPLARANLLVNRSLVNIHRRALAKASEDADAATRIFTGLGLEIDAAQARHNEGYIMLLGGDLVGALHEMRLARASLEGLSPVALAIGDLDRAEVLRDAGLTSDAERILEDVARVFGAHRMPQSRAEAEFHLARSMLAHDPPRAAKVAAIASRRFRALGVGAWHARSEGVRLRAALQTDSVESAGGVRARAAGSPRRRLPPAGEVRTAVAELERHGFRSEARALNLTWKLALARRGDRDGGTVRVGRSEPLEVRILAHEVRAERAAAMGKGASARRLAGGGLDMVADWRRSFGSVDLQTSVGMHSAGLMFLGLRSAVESENVETLFDWSERARHLSQEVVPLRPPPDPELAADLSELRMLRADDPAVNWLDSPRARELRERARDRQWSDTAPAAVTGRVGLTELQEGLPGDTAFVSYVYSGERLVALVATRDGARLVDLPDWSQTRALLNGLRADLDMEAAIRSGPMAGVVREALADRLAALSRALLDPVTAVSDVRWLALAVPGVLNGVPWAMLPGMAGRAFTVAVSASRWASFERTRSAPTRPAGFVSGPRVPRSEEEVARAAESWDGPIALRGAEATASAVTALAREVDVLHIAAHGRHAADNPMFSGLELVDGTLFGYDIDLIPQVPATVVLSACEVGRSSVAWGEEAVGMTRIWLHAGTRCVVAAPVIVADDDACELLAAMHDGLAAGVSPSEALAAASERTGIVAPFQVHGAGF
ncbi:CHAT domain-containing tetratricopeptide repeat protein [Microbacterium sp. 2FI]|uniref:CHAT domain-containing protein n=1 Tax=Microbacterium sp. 2FI TaxID=2502193 RepID=UPI002016C7E1|nr:CHAT domain-containing tetratricopeptide repeat protein [Microbacterium sp. 2FI]